MSQEKEKEIEKENENRIENPNASEENNEEEREAKEQILATKAAILFVHGLDKKVDEGMIYKLFNNYNVMYIKLAKDETTGVSLGYAFVGFGNREKAGQALEEVNYSRLMNKTVRLSWYDRTKNNPRKNPANNIFVKNIPKTVGSKEFHEYFTKYGKVVAAKIAEDEDGDSLGYGYVLFENETFAKKAIEENHGKLWKDTKMKLYVCQLERKRPRKPLRFNNLYVRNIPKDWDVEQLKKYFSQYGEISSAIVRSPNAERVHKNTPKCISSNIFEHNYGFVCFKSIDGPAEKAVTKVPYMKIKDEAYNKQVEEYAQIFRGIGIKEEDVYKCTCFVHEKKLNDKMKTEEGLAEIKKSFLELMDYNEGFYPVRDVEDRLYCCQALKKKEREKRLRVICEKLKNKVRARFKFCNLYVKHLPDNFDKEALMQLFSKFGAIRSARIIKQDKTDPNFQFIKRRTRVFAFVCYFTPEEAKQAKQQLNGKIYMRNGPKLYVDYHQTKKERVEFLKLEMIKKVQESPYKYYVEPLMPKRRGRRSPPMYRPFIVQNPDYSRQQPQNDQNANVPKAEAQPQPYQIAPPLNPKDPIFSQGLQVLNLNTFIPDPNTPMLPINPSVPVVTVNPLMPNNPILQIGSPTGNVQMIPMVPVNPNAPMIPVNPNTQMVPVNPHAQIMPVNPHAGMVPQVNTDINTNINVNVQPNAENTHISPPASTDDQFQPENFNIGPIFKTENNINNNKSNINKSTGMSDKLYGKLIEHEKYSKYQHLFPKIVKIMLRFKQNDLEILVSRDDLFVHHMDQIIPIINEEAEREAKLREERRKNEEEIEQDIWTMGVDRQYEEDDNIDFEAQKQFDIDFEKEIDWKNVLGNIAFLKDDAKE